METDQPEEYPERDRRPKPIRWVIRCYDAIRHEHAPHWTLAVLTFFLVVFAYKAWNETIKTTQALQAQLNVLRAQQRPFVYSVDVANTNITGLPGFKADTGQIGWNFAYGNFGNAVAYHLSAEVYIKIGDDKFQPSGIRAGAIPTHLDLPPTAIKWATALSREGFNQNYFDKVFKTDGGIKIRVIFRYYSSDTIPRTEFTSGFCLSHYSNNTVSILTPDECPD